MTVAMAFKRHQFEKGQRLLPSIVDGLAEDEPTRILFHVFRNQAATTPTPVSTLQFANAINFMCLWFRSNLSNTAMTVVGYIGPNDLRYFILMLAGVKVGAKILLCSPRNSLENNLALIKESNCSAWLSASEEDANDILAAKPMPRYIIPSLFDMLEAEKVPSYPYTKSFDDGRWDVLAILQTSGSTGRPKQIPLYLGTAACVDGFHLMESADGKRPFALEWANTTMLCAMPLFHTAGICHGIYSTLFFEATIVLPPPGPISIGLIEGLLGSIPLNAAMIPPSILNQMAKSPTDLKKLENLDFVISGGGPVSQFAGEVISRHSHLHQIMGSTEGQLYASFPTGRSDWAFFSFATHTGYNMVLIGDGLYELVFKRQPLFDLTQPIFVAFPEESVWHTNDLYSAHPSTPGLWKFEGRKDDVIVLSNGEKLNPLEAEAQLAKTSIIHAACLIGFERTQIAALIQLVKGVAKSDKDIQKVVQEAIDDCNTSLPSHARIHRRFIKIVDEPFVWTPKGTMARQATYSKFKEEIESLYSGQSMEPHPITSDFDALQATLLKAAHEILGNESLNVEDDFFQAGFDSLSVQTLQDFIKELPVPGRGLDMKAIYNNPSIHRLSTAIWTTPQLALNQALNTNSGLSDEIRALLRKYTLVYQTEPKGTIRVILTGSTGFLGSYLLDVLVASPLVSEIWCLNRSQDAYERQVKSAKNKGLRHDWGPDVRFLTAQFDLPAFGLSAIDYDTLLHSANHIIHNAWQVNFNLSAWSFETQIAGVNNIIQFCTKAKNPVHVCYISSISIASNWTSTHAGSVPEASIQDMTAPTTGYGASKFIAEHLLERSARSGILQLTVCRVGQLSGPVQRGSKYGVWNPREWIPTLIRASSAMKAVPEDLGRFDAIDWVPIDIAATVITQMLSCTDPLNIVRIRFFHVLNPKTTSWNNILPLVQTRLQRHSGQNVDILPLTDWIEKLQQSSVGKESQDVRSKLLMGNDGSALVDFYQSLVLDNLEELHTVDYQFRWDLENSLKASSELGSLDPVNAEWVDMWFDQWGY